MPGLYNPRYPLIAGPEWVPIREPDVQFSRYDTPVELGYTFTLPAQRTLNRGFFYIKDFPEDFILMQPYTMSLYPAGSEADTGPVERVLINVSTLSSFTNTGSTTGNHGIRLVNANTVCEALQDPSSDSFVQMVTGSLSQFHLDLQFNVDPYENVLRGKRILGVNFVYSALLEFNNLDPRLVPNYRWSIWNNTGVANRIDYNLLTRGIFVPNRLNRCALGDTNFEFGVTDTRGVQNVAPWTIDELLRFNSGAADILYLRCDAEVLSPDLGEFINLNYMAMEVIYCEERRVAVATGIIGPLFNNHYTIPPSVAPQPVIHDLWYQYNRNLLSFRDTTNYAVNPVIPAGEYTLTLAQSNVGDLQIDSQFPVPPPTLQATRQLYSIEKLDAVQINHPVPVDNKILGRTFTKESTDVLPQMSLWDSSDAQITTVHAYGRQTQGQVDATTSVNQNLDTSALVPYDYVRFYARTFGSQAGTLILTSPGSVTSVSISPNEFAALDPIVDGWKEVTLPFTSPLAVSGTAGNWTWTHAGPAGSRWEVVGASCIAYLGVCDLAQTAETVYPPNGATYGGATYREIWAPGYPVPDSVTQTDTSSDAILMLAQKLAAPTGFTLTALNQPLSGIATDCNAVPGGIPSAISYNRLTWDLSNGLFLDQFARVAASGFGGTWSVSLGSTAAFAANGSAATITSTSSLNYYVALDSTTYTNVEATVTASFASTSSPDADLWLGASAGGNGYRFALGIDTTGAGNIEISYCNGTNPIANATSLILQQVPMRILPGHFYKMKAQMWDGLLRAKVWEVGTDEPDAWLAQGADNHITSGKVGLGAVFGTGAVSFDDLYVTPAYLVGSTVELERSDTIDTDWQVIMAANSNMWTTSFNDYEARVGIATSYRLRFLDTYRFEGTYTSTLTGTLASPGASGSSINHLLLFTTNERQSGSSNLAYSLAWLNTAVQEDFSFPEAGFTQLQAMYNRDFLTAFHPLERGGEQFRRDILVQAAAISPPTLADFTSLRDMAWDSVPYICVRDEAGNRWFANVTVPQGTVQHYRKLYIAQVTVAQVTDVPSQVDP